MVDWLRDRANTSRLKVHLMDGEHLSVENLWVPPQSLLVSSMCAQWFGDLNQAIRRWVSVSNTVAFSILMDGSFEAWHQAHEETGQQVGLQPLPPACAIEDLIHSLRAEGLVRSTVFKTREFSRSPPRRAIFCKKSACYWCRHPKAESQAGTNYGELFRNWDLVAP